jgi:hypothetical protein
MPAARRFSGEPDVGNLQVRFDEGRVGRVLPTFALSPTLPRDSFLRFAGVTENEVAKQIVDVAYRIHTTLGPGLLESV